MSKSKGKRDVWAYSQVRLDVDLTKRTITESFIPKDFCHKWIGGYGFGVKVLWDELKPGIDPLGPENIFVFALAII